MTGWPSGNGVFPLHAAAMHGSVEAARALVKAGADVNQRLLGCMLADMGNISPIWVAVRNGDLAMVKTLVELGADLLMQCKIGSQQSQAWGLTDWAYDSVGSGNGEKVLGYLRGLPASLRFRSGERVLANIGSEFVEATVKKLWWHDAKMHRSGPLEAACYQIKVGGQGQIAGSLIFAPRDDDRFIKEDPKHPIVGRILPKQEGVAVMGAGQVSWSRTAMLIFVCWIISYWIYGLVTDFVLSVDRERLYKLPTLQ